MGNVRGVTIARYGSPIRNQTLAGADLYFYALPSPETEALGTTVVAKRPAFAPLDSLPAGAIGSAHVAVDGTFNAELKGYEGQSLGVVMRVEKFEYAPATGKTAIASLGMMQPRRDANGKGLILTIDL